MHPTHSYLTPQFKVLQVVWAIRSLCRFKWLATKCEKYCLSIILAETQPTLNFVNSAQTQPDPFDDVWSSRPDFIRPVNRADAMSNYGLPLLVPAPSVMTFLPVIDHSVHLRRKFFCASGCCPSLKTSVLKILFYHIYKYWCSFCLESFTEKKLFAAIVCYAAVSLL